MTIITSQTVELIPLQDLHVHERNVRKDVGDITELAASIKAQGILEPLIAVRQNGGFAVIAGSRRLAAAKRVQLGVAPVIVRDLTEAEAAAAALVENLQRKDLSPLEEAEGYRTWLDLTKQTQRELAKSIGKDESTIANALRLLQAPQPVKDALAARNITPAHARVALALKDPSLATKLSLKTGVTVDDLKEEVDDLNEEAALRGAPAVAAAKAFLDKARREHPKATVTWQKHRLLRLRARFLPEKELSPEEIAREEAREAAELRKEHERQATESLELAKPRKPDYKPLFAAVRKVQIPAGVARLIVAHDRLVSEFGVDVDDEAALIAWARLEKMPAKKVSELAASIVADRFCEEIQFMTPTMTGAVVARTVARSYGLKLPEPKQPKAKKKAKR